MKKSSKERKTLSLKKPFEPKEAPLEYRLIWNEDSHECDVYRNGAKTGLARRKKQSAVDNVILAIQSDVGTSRMGARIISVKGRTSTIEWTRTSLSNVAG